MMAARWAGPLPHTDHTPRTDTTASVSRVKRLRGSARDVMTAAPPNLQSMLRLKGLKKSQLLTKQR